MHRYIYLDQLNIRMIKLMDYDGNRQGLNINYEYTIYMDIFYEIHFS